jgi:hypothetical protein
MPPSLLAALALVVSLAGAARAETLGDILKLRGISPSPGRVAGLDRVVASHQILDDERDLLVVYAVGEGGSARLYATRFGRASSAWQTAPLAWSIGELPIESCLGGIAIERFAGGFLVGAHINPSAECTIVLGEDLAVRAVLAGWPVAKLTDGRLVYQRNQVHFASVHPVALALFDPRKRGDLAVYPRTPYQSARTAHIARMRAVYTEAWCRAHNHPCDPDLFDERVTTEVTSDARGDALAFAMAWDNTAGWSDVERWGRLEAFREVRGALARWDGRSAAPADLYRDLAAGLARMRNLGREAAVVRALEGEPALRDLVAAALTSPPALGQVPRSWLEALDARWAEVATWQALARAVAVPDELTEVVYVYTGLRRPGTIRYRELLRRDFEARFGAIPLSRALEPDVLRRIFATGS